MTMTIMHKLDIDEIKRHFGNLTRRESEVLYYLIRGYSARETAERLDVKKRTVIGYIDNIKNRWGVTSRGKLIEKAINMGYAHVIPSSLEITALSAVATEIAVI